jgi:DNA-binding ferritin-like protein
VSELFVQLGIIAAATVSGIAAIFAAKAERNSRPVSNGFAEEVLTDLREMRQMLFRHLKEHDQRDTNGTKDCLCNTVKRQTRKRKTAIRGV